MKIVKSINEFVSKKIAGKIVLLLGCSGKGVHMGKQAKVISRVVKDWYGFDICQEFIDKNKQWKLFRVDLNEDWDIEINDVEVVVITEVLEHLYCPIRTLRTIKRNFSGRKLIASVPNGASIGKFILASLRHPMYIKQDWDHLMMFNVKTIQNTFEKAGIQKFQMYYYELHWYFRPFVNFFPYLAEGFIIEAEL